MLSYGHAYGTAGIDGAQTGPVFSAAGQDTCICTPGSRRHPPTPAQVARRLGLTTQTVTRWCRAGRFPHAHRTDAGKWLIPAEDLEAVPSR